MNAPQSTDRDGKCCPCCLGLEVEQIAVAGCDEGCGDDNLYSFGLRITVMQKPPPCCSAQVEEVFGSDLTLSDASMFPDVGSGVLFDGASVKQYFFNGKSDNVLHNVSGVSGATAKTSTQAQPSVQTTYAGTVDIDTTTALPNDLAGPALPVDLNTTSLSSWTNGVAEVCIKVTKNPNSEPVSLVLSLVDRDDPKCAGTATITVPPCECTPSTYPKVNMTVSWTGTPSSVKHSVTSISVTSGGSGYSSAPAVSITGGGGYGATAIAKLSTTGEVRSVEVTNIGQGYTSAPTISFSGGGGGSGASANAEITESLQYIGRTWLNGEVKALCPTLYREGTTSTGAPYTAISDYEVWNASKIRLYALARYSVGFPANGTGRFNIGIYPRLTGSSHLSLSYFLMFGFPGTLNLISSLSDYEPTSLHSLVGTFKEMNYIHDGQFGNLTTVNGVSIAWERGDGPWRQP